MSDMHHYDDHLCGDHDRCEQFNHEGDSPTIHHHHDGRDILIHDHDDIPGPHDHDLDGNDLYPSVASSTFGVYPHTHPKESSSSGASLDGVSNVLAVETET